MVSVTAAVQQMAQLVPAEASYDYAVHKNWAAAGAAAVPYQSLNEFIQMTGFASAH